jgi:hypothetical protein
MKNDLPSGRPAQLAMSQGCYTADATVFKAISVVQFSICKSTYHPKVVPFLLK